MNSSKKNKRTLNAITFGRKRDEILKDIPEAFRQYLIDRTYQDLYSGICEGYFSHQPDDHEDEYYFSRLVKYRDELAPIISRYTVEILNTNTF